MNLDKNGQLWTGLAALLLVLMIADAAICMPQAPRQPRLIRHRLRDGSASFLIPRGWRVRDHGETRYWATDPTGTMSFVASRVDMITPRIRARVPGVIKSDYLAPHRAQQLVLARTNLLHGIRFEHVTRRHATENALRQVYTLGSVRAEHYLYSGRGRHGRVRAFTMGVCFYSRMGTNWSLWHFTVAAPANRFRSMAPTFAVMLRSFRVNRGWVKEYLRAGAERLEWLMERNLRVIGRASEPALADRRRFGGGCC